MSGPWIRVEDCRGRQSRQSGDVQWELGSGDEGDPLCGSGGTDCESPGAEVSQQHGSANSPHPAIVGRLYKHREVLQIAQVWQVWQIALDFLNSSLLLHREGCSHQGPGEQTVTGFTPQD